jgi:hypothetical protein
MINHNLTVDQNQNVYQEIELLTADRSKNYLILFLCDGKIIFNKATNDLGGNNDLIITNNVSIQFISKATDSLLLSGVEISYKLYEIPVPGIPVQIFGGTIEVIPLVGTELPIVQSFSISVPTRRVILPADHILNSDFLLLIDTDNAGLGEGAPFSFVLTNPATVPGKQIIIKRLGSHDVDITCAETGQAVTLPDDGEASLFISGQIAGHDDQFTWHVFNI